VKMVKRFPGTDTAKVWDPVAQQMRLFEKITFEYDHRGRRIAKRYFETASSATPIVTYLFLYDGWNVICELDAAKNRLRTYVWGTDLSGTLSGAGGVGGLLWVNNYQPVYAGKNQPTGVHFVAYDGNGNAAALVNAASGTTQARYEYGPFAEPVRTTGDLADANPFRFSTKWTENESGLLYYGYRYYNPTAGRWLSRDPAYEHVAGPYEFLRNDPLQSIDRNGLLSLVSIGTPAISHDGQAWFAGVWFSFSSEDAIALAGRGTLVWVKEIDYSIYPCARNTLSWGATRRMWFKKEFELDKSGSFVEGRGALTEQSLFGPALGTTAVALDVANYSITGLIYSSPGATTEYVNALGKSRGSFSAVVQWAVLPGNLPPGDIKLIPEGYWGYDHRTSHAARPTAHWTNWTAAVAKGTLTVRVEWDQCDCLTKAMSARTTVPVRDKGASINNLYNSVQWRGWTV